MRWRGEGINRSCTGAGMGATVVGVWCTHCTGINGITMPIGSVFRISFGDKTCFLVGGLRKNNFLISTDMPRKFKIAFVRHGVRNTATLIMVIK